MTFNEILKQAISKNIRVEISYKNSEKESSVRQLSNINYSNEFQKAHNNSYEYISAHCHLRNEKRTFKLNRIERIRLIDHSNKSEWVKNPDCKSDTSGCYIATMAYGNFNHPQVKFLREFRDEVLIKNPLGKLFVAIYYFVSPQIVSILKNQHRTNKIIRKILDTLIEGMRKVR